MKPVRVDFRFVDMVSVSDQPLHLDGLLAWAAVKLATEAGELDLTSAAASLPLARHGTPEVWCASALSFDYLTPPSIRTMVRKTDVEDYVDAISEGRIDIGTRGRQQIPVNSGPLRNHLFSYAIRQAKGARAWCVGEPDRIRELLAEITHVGRHGRMGFGEVAGIDVTEDPEAAEKWKLRHLPWREDGYIAGIGNYRAPYWDRTTMTQIYAPPSPPLAA